MTSAGTLVLSFLAIAAPGLPASAAQPATLNATPTASPTVEPEPSSSSGDNSDEFLPDEGPDTDPEPDPDETTPEPEPTLDLPVPTKKPPTDDRLLAPACDNRGTKWFVWSNIAKPGVITHKEMVVNDTDNNYDYEETVEVATTVSAEATLTYGAGVTENLAVAELEQHVEISLQVAGSKTSTRSIKVKGTVGPGKVAIFYGGTTKVTGSYTRYNCDAGGALRTAAKGKAQSWTIQTKGAIQCNRAGSTSLAKLAKKRYCPA